MALESPLLVLKFNFSEYVKSPNSFLGGVSIKFQVYSQQPLLMITRFPLTAVD